IRSHRSSLATASSPQRTRRTQRFAEEAWDRPCRLARRAVSRITPGRPGPPPPSAVLCPPLWPLRGTGPFPRRPGRTEASTEFHAAVDVDRLAGDVGGGGEIDGELPDVVGGLGPAEWDQGTHVARPGDLLVLVRRAELVGQVFPHLGTQDAWADGIGPDAV